MARIKKDEFVKRVAEQTNLSTYKANKVVDTIVDEIRSIVENGDTISFSMLGLFYSGKLAKRRYYNPQDGSIVEHPERFYTQV